ncbi:I78 family peptidase inhibitor [Luteimonas sp. RIT-PG2_3]
MSLARLIVVTTLTLAAGCSSLQPPPGAPDERAAASGTCHADKVQWAIGEQATQDVTARVWRESHAGLIRPIAPNQPVTRDYRQDRINIDIDAGNVIRKAWCG